MESIVAELIFQTFPLSQFLLGLLIQFGLLNSHGQMVGNPFNQILFVLGPMAWSMALLHTENASDNAPVTNGNRQDGSNFKFLGQEKHRLHEWVNADIIHSDGLFLVQNLLNMGIALNRYNLIGKVINTGGRLPSLCG
jgi:hypothetical protein